mmetsp:Transcript_31519/g.74327  ORF Transcript_31519/g.74327 Transcript_31519/m.74327 type:complete len:239 (-) Transcript_31519:2824-3540(-)
MRSWSMRTMRMKKSGTSSRQQFVQYFLRWTVRFLRNRASACLTKGVWRLLTRASISSAVIRTRTCSEVVERALARFACSLTISVVLKVSPAFSPGGTSTANFCPRHSTWTGCPGRTSAGTVTCIVCCSALDSMVLTAMRLPSSSVPHLTRKMTPPGDCSSSSLPRGTDTFSPLWSSTSTGLLAAASFSAWAATPRKTSSRVDIESCTSAIPSSSLRASSSIKRSVIAASVVFGTSKCM